MALRQAAFTFTMPVGGNPSSGVTPQQTRQGSQHASKQSTPAADSPDELRSVKDVGPPSRQSPSFANSGPAAAVTSDTASSAASSQINLFADDESAFTAAALGGRDLGPRQNHSESNSSVVSPEQSGTNGKTELDALWSSFLAQGPNRDQQTKQWNASANPYSLQNAQQSTAFCDSSAKFGGNQGTAGMWDKTTFRDGSSGTEPEVPKSQNPAVQTDDWANADQSVEDFLASLAGSTNKEKESFNEVDFNSQLQELLGAGASPSAMFNLPNNLPSSLPNNPFSPTNYLNMSPSPLNSISNDPSPPRSLGQTTSDSSSTPASSVQSGQSPDANGTLVCRLPTPGDSEPIYVVDDKGKIVKPSELWTRMGMQNKSNVEHLIIDDLCTMMRAKATCQDGKKVVKASDAEELFMYRGPDEDHDARMRALEKRAGLPTGMLGPRP